LPDLSTRGRESPRRSCSIWAYFGVREAGHGLFFFNNTYIHQVCCYLYGSLLAHDLFVGLLPYLFLSRLGCSWFGWMARAGDRLARKRRSGRNDTSLVAADGSFRVGETCPSPTDELYLDVGLLYPTSWTKGPAGFSRLFLKILLP
jgi:hypothetical protein